MDKERRVVVTGIGVAAGNGTGKESYISNCERGKSGIKKCTVFDTARLRTDYFGQVEEVLVTEMTNPGEEDRMEQLMRLTLSEMMEDAGMTKEKLSAYGDRAYLCFGTLLAATDRIMAFTRRDAKGNRESKWLEHSVDYISWIKENSGIRGGTYISGAACAAGTTAAGIAFEFIKNGLCDVAVVGGADPLTEAAAVGFHVLQSLSMGICNPYDENRDGINIGEGSAFLFFETLENAQMRQARIYGEILGYGLNNDAYHMTSPHPEGAAAIASMKMALQEAGVEEQMITYINGHGTGTLVNDKMEMQAIHKVFPEQEIAVNSTKALIGHCMGASGAVELAAMLLSMDKGIYLPMPELSNPLPQQGDCIFSDKAFSWKAKYGISNSFAFAGNTASILAAKYQEKQKQGNEKY